MNSFQKTIEIRWADLDPNFHVIHSKYYDFGAYCRMSFLVENGLTPAVMFQQHLGPILFREECVFKREILFGDTVTIDVKVDKLTQYYGRWTMVHHIYKNNDTLAAIITCDGAWIDTQKRKLALPTDLVKNMFEKLPKTDTFSFTD